MSRAAATTKLVKIKIKIKMKKTFPSQSGQALLEAVFILPLFGALLFLFSFFYFKFTQKAVIESLVDQTLLCSTSHKLKSCENSLREKIKKISSQVYIKELNIYELSTASSTTYKLVLQYSFWNDQKIFIRRSLQWID